MTSLTKKQIAVLFPLTVSVWTVTLIRLGFSFYGIVTALLLTLLAVVSVEDWCTQEIKVYMLIAIALLSVPSFFATASFSLLSRFLGAVIISVPLSSFAKKNAGIGTGDVWLTAVCGLVVGAKSIIFGVFFGMIIAAVAGLIIRACTGKKRIALAPWISLGIAIVLLY